MAVVQVVGKGKLGQLGSVRQGGHEGAQQRTLSRSSRNWRSSRHSTFTFTFQIAKDEKRAPPARTGAPLATLADAQRGNVLRRVPCRPGPPSGCRATARRGAVVATQVDVIGPSAMSRAPGSVPAAAALRGDSSRGRCWRCSRCWTRHSSRLQRGLRATTRGPVSRSRYPRGSAPRVAANLAAGRASARRWTGGARRGRGWPGLAGAPSSGLAAAQRTGGPLLAR